MRAFPAFRFLGATTGRSFAKARRTVLHREVCSSDGTLFLLHVEDGDRRWEVWFEGAFLAARRTRREARGLVRALKGDPGLAEAIRVHAV